MVEDDIFRAKHSMGRDINHIADNYNSALSILYTQKTLKTGFRRKLEMQNISKFTEKQIFFSERFIYSIF